MERTGILTYYNQVLTLSGLLLTITESIRGLAQKGQVEQIAARLQKRQDVIDQLKVIEKRLTPPQEIQKDTWKSIAPQDKNGIQSLVKSIRKVIERVETLDIEIRTLVDREKKRIADELKKVSTSHKLMKKYVPSRTNTPGYFSLSI
ncbi:MAG: flagellar protein FliT [Thermodesulfobacteriota bacterium]|nr:flagellar protein FliT [Thermodesulfobacteriota bacterium]